MAITHNYTEPGEYTVTLRVTDSENNVGIKTKKIKILAPTAPLPMLRVSAGTCVAPCEIEFDGADTTLVPGPTDAPASIVSWEWDFGDGETGSETEETGLIRSSVNYPLVLPARWCGRVQTARFQARLARLVRSERPENRERQGDTGYDRIYRSRVSWSDWRGPTGPTGQAEWYRRRPMVNINSAPGATTAFRIGQRTAGLFVRTTTIQQIDLSRVLGPLHRQQQATAGRRVPNLTDAHGRSERRFLYDRWLYVLGDRD